MKINSQKKNLNQTIIKSIIYVNIIDLFKIEKNIDLSPYLISIKVNNHNIIIKTNKPLINSELLNIDNKLKEKLIEKFKKAGIIFYDFEIKYI